MQTPEAQTARTKAALAKHDLLAVQDIELTDPITGKKTMVSLDRTGHTEQKLVIALANPELTRDQKDHALSMYMYERGAHNTSFILDLMRYKGQHSKESQVFKSQMRFDFQTFVDSFVAYLHNQSQLIGITLGIDIEKEQKEFRAWLMLPNNKGLGLTYFDYAKSKAGTDSVNTQRMALIEMAIMAQDEATSLKFSIEQIVKARDAARGGGIYLDLQGRPFSLNDPALDDIIKTEREIVAEAEKDNDR